jgi:hypothetical protein
VATHWNRYEARDPFDWCILAKIIVHFKQPTLALMLKRVCSNIAAENKTAVSLDTFVTLFIVNNDTLVQIPSTFNNVVPHDVLPHTNG